ncbi:MAG: wax ester/triacylglycerol synthase family O-acyltransferase [Acidimicrobiales bacterium]
MDELRFQDRKSDSDALMWTIEKDPMLRSTITAVSMLDRAPDPERLRHLLERGTRLVPRMRQRVRGNPLSVAPPRWEFDPHFDLDYHLRWVGASGEKDLRSVLDLAEPMAMQGFDRARPLWEMVVVTDLADGGAALVMKIHHAITDGVGAVQIALVLFELEQDAPLAAMPDAPEVTVMGQAQRFVDAFEHERRRNLGIAKRLPEVATTSASAVVTDPVGTARKVGETLASVARLAAPANVPLSPLMATSPSSVHFDTITLSLTEAKAAARAGGRLNDAFLAATAAGLRRYHEEMGSPIEAVRVSVPINLRGEGEGDATGNNFAPARSTRRWPRRIRLVGHGHHAGAGGRAAPSRRALHGAEPLARILNRLPTSVTTGFLGAALKGIDLVASNVPGAPIELFTAGARIRSMFALGPLAGSAVNVTLLSYLDQVHIGVNLDPAAVTEPERFLRCYQEGWDEILAAGRPATPPARKKGTRSS